MSILLERQGAQAVDRRWLMSVQEMLIVFVLVRFLHFIDYSCNMSDEELLSLFETGHFWLRLNQCLTTGVREVSRLLIDIINLTRRFEGVELDEALSQAFDEMKTAVMAYDNLVEQGTEIIPCMLFRAGEMLGGDKDFALVELRKASV